MDLVSRKPQVPILFFLMSLSNVLGVLYAAALPDLTQYFHITKGVAQDTGSIYIAGGLLAQFVYAPISSAIGRKSAVYLGGLFALLGSALCLLAIQMEMFSLLLFGRWLTAFGAACGLILTNVWITDTYSSTETKKILSYLMSGFAIFPAVGITIGGWITESFSWKGCFVFMLLYTVFVIGLCIFLPETGKEKGFHHLHPVKIAKSYIQQLSNVPAILYSLIVACASIILYVFSVEAPFIAHNQLHISPSHFGFYNLIPNIGMFLGAITAARLSHKYRSKWPMLIGASAFTLFSFIMWMLFDVGFVNGVVLFGMPLLIFLVTPVILSYGQFSALVISENKSYASSVLYIVQYVGMILGISALRLFSPQDASGLPIVYFCSGVIMIVLWLIVYGLMQKPQRSS